MRQFSPFQIQRKLKLPLGILVTYIISTVVVAILLSIDAVVETPEMKLRISLLWSHLSAFVIGSAVTALQFLSFMPNREEEEEKAEAIKLLQERGL